MAAKTVSTQPRPPASAPASTGLVPAVERAIGLIDHLAESRKPATLAEIVRDLDLPKSSAHGLLATLAAFGLVERLPGGEFALGPRVLQWAHAYTLQSDVVGAFNQFAAEKTGLLGVETLMLAVLDGADVVYLACRPGSRALAVNYRVGGRFPACCTASGKAMLATLPDVRVKTLMADGGLRRLTRQSVASTGALRKQLERIRKSGFAIDDEETANGMHCYGAAVFAAGHREAAAAVAVSLIKASTTPRRTGEIVTAIRELASRLSERLGAAGPATAGAIGRIPCWS
jgi:IclR family transcriptional regulator, blcABC operon repressor